MLGELAAEAGLPAGALNIVTGGPPGSDTGIYFGQHAGFDKLSFTGSGPTGIKLLHASADLLRPTGLELGGKGALVVCEDADLDAVTDWVMVGIFLCTGQVCSATSRLIVHRSVRDQVVERLVAKSHECLRVGDPMDANVNMGPAASADQRDKVMAAITVAEQQCGPSLLDASAFKPTAGDLEGGFFVPPAIFDAPVDSELWREEVFGPVLAVATFETDEEAIAMANDSPYGLAHGVMTSSESRGRKYTRGLKSGVVWENCSQPLYPDTPFGGAKQSGFGREYGAMGLEEYVLHKTSIRAKSGHSWGWYVN